MQYKRHIPLENIQNCRDLGGYPMKDGNSTKFGRLLRCGVPKKITENDLKFLRQYGIKTVFDLRGDEESKAIPTSLECTEGINYNQISLLEVNPAFPNLDRTMPEIYLATIRDNDKNVGKLFKMLSNLTEPALFHCFLGKDRTGITASLILSLHDVYFEDIVADYRVSATYLEPFYRYEIENDTGLIWEQDSVRLDSRPENILEVFNYLDMNYASVQDYLMKNGVTADEVDRVSCLLR